MNPKLDMIPGVSHKGTAAKLRNHSFRVPVNVVFFLSFSSAKAFIYEKILKVSFKILH